MRFGQGQDQDNFETGPIGRRKFKREGNGRLLSFVMLWSQKARVQKIACNIYLQTVVENATDHFVTDRNKKVAEILHSQAFLHLLKYTKAALNDTNKGSIQNVYKDYNE